MRRATIKTRAAQALFLSGAAALLRAARGAPGPLVLGYHRVVEDFDESARRAIPSLLISARMLERHVEWVQRRYRIVTLDELRAAVERGDGARLAALTFDDGYADVYEHALPVLRRRGVPAAVFVVTDLVGSGRRLLHDRLYAVLTTIFARAAAPAAALRAVMAEAGLEAFPALPSPAGPFPVLRALLPALAADSLDRIAAALEARWGEPAGDEPGRPLDWEMLRALQRAGVTIGSHTRTHALLTAEPAERRDDEIGASRRDLEARLGERVGHLAYPDGRFDAATVAAAARAGYRAAYTICAHRDRVFPLFTIPRRVLWEKSCADGGGRFAPALMRAQAWGLFDAWRACRDAHQTTREAA